jgi:hypothetical protein
LGVNFQVCPKSKIKRLIFSGVNFFLHGHSKNRHFVEKGDRREMSNIIGFDGRAYISRRQTKLLT